MYIKSLFIHDPLYCFFSVSVCSTTCSAFFASLPSPISFVSCLSTLLGARSYRLRTSSVTSRRSWRRRNPPAKPMGSVALLEKVDVCKSTRQARATVDGDADIRDTVAITQQHGGILEGREVVVQFSNTTYRAMAENKPSIHAASPCDGRRGCGHP
jgi:hypothetical protein